MSVAVAVQVRLLEVLRAALEPTVKVYQDAPTAAEFPFVTIDRTLDQPVDTQTTLLTERFIYLSIWSTVHGNDEVLGILDRIKAALHRADLNPLNAGRAVFCLVTRTDSRLDQDEITYVGAVTLRVVTQDS